MKTFDSEQNENSYVHWGKKKKKERECGLVKPVRAM